MVASTELNPVPPSSNPYIAPLTGPYGFRAGYVVTYALQGNPGDTSPMGGALWAQANAAQAFQLAAEAWAAVANIKIIPIATGYDGSGTTTATWVEKLEKLDENILGEHALPGTGRLGGSFSNTSPFFTASNNAVGGYSFVTFLHEIGHGLGLLHPHGEGDAFPGVAGEQSWGDNGLNQLIYTVMSYNDGLEDSFTSSDAFGWSQTPMAFDIAAIQHIYGANLSTATGDSVYRLPAVNGAGVGWTCIWDAGGIDTISAAGTEQGTTIDLRPASLLNEANGGGFLSRIAGVSGGFTIANGVVIENAIGSMGSDVINGNERGNHLTGNGGYDVIEGFGGDDWIEGSGRLSGGNGDDRIIASGSGNNLSGGEGADYLEGMGYLDGGDGNDHIIMTRDNAGFGGLFGGAGNDILVGSVGNDIMNGGNGRDTMTGGVGNDSYIFDDAGDQIIELNGQGIDQVDAYLSYNLSTAVENARLFGSAAVKLTGNILDNLLYGNEIANVLDGGAGQDTMAGGAGDDIYYVDDEGDVVLEYRSRGFDTVYSGISYALPDLPIDSDPYAGPSVPVLGQKNEIERLILQGSGNIAGTGNEAANELVGNGGNNRLSGMGGNDVLVSAAGYDTIDGGTGFDTLVLGGKRASYTVMNAVGTTLFLGAAGSAQVVAVEQVRFGEGTRAVSMADAAAGAQVFDAISYIASYADLRALLGTDANAGTAHFVNGGYAEGRSVTFDGWGYLASYSDLRTAFGPDLTAAARHFIIAGSEEGRTVTFDGLAYIASYSDLISAYGTDVKAGARHFVIAGAAEGRSTTFDALAYTASHADLRSAFGVDELAATRHFIIAGSKEGRAVTFDGLAYIASYSDLISAFGANVNAGAWHFIIAGAAEGRSTTFDALSYTASYADLRSAFGVDESAATRHFIIAGSKEGRAVTFDGLSYIASYSDLISAFGNDEQSATRHFIQYGASEGRRVSFDPLAYAAANPDLAAAYGNNSDALAYHYIGWGFAEGRQTSPAAKRSTAAFEAEPLSFADNGSSLSFQSTFLYSAADHGL